jgi:hypothetical protein
MGMFRLLLGSMAGEGHKTPAKVGSSGFDLGSTGFDLGSFRGAFRIFCAPFEGGNIFFFMYIAADCPTSDLGSFRNFTALGSGLPLRGSSTSDSE